MFELHEIEELFKSEDLIKNKAMIHALLRNAAMLHNEGVNEEQKKQALENIKAITHGKPVPKQKAQKQKQVQPNITPKYHPIYQHYGISQEHWNAAKPDAHKELFDYHNNVMAGKVPEMAHVKTAIEQQKAASMKKSVEHLYELFQQLKKQL